MNLGAVAIELGLERTGYESEQFPKLIYRPTEFDCVLLIFSSGEVVITGASEVDTAQQAFTDLLWKVKENSYKIHISAFLGFTV